MSIASTASPISLLRRMSLFTAAPCPTADDLAENREGRLSPAQDAAVREWLSRPVRFSSQELVRDDSPPVRQERALALAGALLLVAGVTAWIAGVPIRSLAVACLGLVFGGTFLGLGVALVVAIGRFVWRLSRPDPDRAERAALAADLYTGAVEILVGRIEFGGTGYVCRAGERTFPMFPWWVAKLPMTPGDYRLYVLPTSGIVIGFEPVAGSPLAHPDFGTEAGLARFDEAALRHALMAAHQLDEGALAVNRLGRLAPRQLRGAVLDKVIASFGVCWIPLVFWSFVGIVPSDSRLVFGIVVGVITALFSAAIAWLFVALALDARGGVVIAVEGRVERKARGSDEGLYQIGNLSFHVTRQALMALIPELHYRLWYTPHTKVLVGIEPVQAAPEAEAPTPSA